MKELRFKLKKEGRCVGYYWIAPNMYDRYGRIKGRGRFKPIKETHWSPQDINNIDFDSIHPLVCTDSKGREVYEGDHVLDRRDDKIETMDCSFWFLSLEENPSWIELAEEQP